MIEGIFDKMPLSRNMGVGGNLAWVLLWTKLEESPRRNFRPLTNMIRWQGYPGGTENSQISAHGQLIKRIVYDFGNKYIPKHKVSYLV